jgi:hypothetical protein
MVCVSIPLCAWILSIFNTQTYIDAYVGKIHRNNKHACAHFCTTTHAEMELLTTHAEMELIVVEWVPPSWAPRLRDAVAWPDLLQDVTIVTVGDEAAERLGCRCRCLDVCLFVRARMCARVVGVFIYVCVCVCVCMRECERKSL